ncbi:MULTISPECIES: aldo/keto reductase [unclassified Sphingobacterium]|uniref:aldo/keto reductase n=1 Tax=unclassified Sphingobacterium TaxID=2609468 RepID=UPI0025D4A22D|nr:MULTISPECIES: aldo/keto reductase [unclassified Sphingobacterium]
MIPTTIKKLPLVQLPKVIYGTSSLGNLYNEIPFSDKLEIIRACIQQAKGLAVFDTAGKYGAGLSLESLGAGLKQLEIDPSTVLISNKLGWYRIPLEADEPTFEPGVWQGLKYDAEQRISYEGILQCFYQGNEMLGDYPAQLVSVHDPDEYLAKALNQADESQRYQDILEAYRALIELKNQGKVLAVGVGSKSWNTIQRLVQDVDLDWVMIANSLTIHDHPAELLTFIAELAAANITVINSAVFNGGFLVGSDYYNYQLVDRNSEQGKALYEWRDRFWKICQKYAVTPAEACFAYGFGIDGVKAVALNTSKAEKVQANVAMATRKISSAFWNELATAGLT